MASESYSPAPKHGAATSADAAAFLCLKAASAGGAPLHRHGTIATVGTRYTSYPVDATGKVTVSHTFTASATVVQPTGVGGDVTTTLDHYTFSIHAQPYNFRRTYFSNETPPTSVVATAGELQFHYSWSSTSGNRTNLSGIGIHENVDAPSSPQAKDVNGVVVGYLPPLPFDWSPSFHFDSVAVDASSTAGITDDHSWGNGVAALTDCFAKPYQANSFALTQTYKFHDPATMASGVEQLIPGASGPLTITDAVVADPQSASGYSFIVTKSGVPSLPQPLP